MAASGSAVLTSAIITIVTALIGFALFSAFRLWHRTAKFFDPKRDNDSIARKPAPLPTSFFGWVLPVFKYTEPDIIRECGLDTAVYLRLLRYALTLFAVATIYSLGVILPVNYTDDFVDSQMADPDTDYRFTDFDKLSLANVNGKSNRMWAHLGGVYIISGAALWLLWKFSRESVVLRIQFLGNSRATGSALSVLVRDIPGVAGAVKAASKRSSKSGAAEITLKDVEHGTGAGASVEHAEATKLPKVGVAESPKRASSGLNFLAAPPPPASTSLLRQRKVFNYDLTSTSLEPTVMAAQQLDAGSSPLDLVTDEFRLVYGDGVSTVNMVRDQADLEKLVAEYHKRKQEVEDYLALVDHLTAQGKPVPPKKVMLLFPDAWCKEKYGGGMIKKVDAVPFWNDRLHWLEGRIAEEQAAAQAKLWPAAFVTFKSRVAQSVSATGLHHHDEMAWTVRGAPDAKELLWFNLAMTSSMRSSSTLIIWVLFWLMTMFFMIPVGAIQGLIDVPKYAKDIPGLNSFVNNAVVKMLIEAIVPGLALKIFLAILPWILSVMTIRSGAVCLSEVDFGVVSRFFLFQIVVVFFGTILSSSFFSQATQLINNPTSIVTVLGTAIPQSATFFITYVWISMAGVGLSLARIVGVVLFWVFSWLAGSPKAARRVYQEQYTSCGTSVSGHMLVMLVGIVYTCINPIVAPSALVYFAVATVVEKYNNIYVYRRQYESGGKLWRTLLSQVMICLYIFQLAMIGLLAVKKFVFAPLLIPAILATYGFQSTVMRLFARPWEVTSLHDAAQLDINDQISDGEEAAVEQVDTNPYLSPVFKVKEGDAEKLLLQLRSAEAVATGSLTEHAEGA